MPAKTIESTYVHWCDAIDGVGLKLKSVENVLMHGGVLRWPVFLGMSLADVHDHFDVTKEEVEEFSIVALIASAEAAFVEDYNHRKRISDSSVLGRSICSTPAYSNGQPKIDKLIDSWINNISGAMARSLLSAYKVQRELRHWVAHGRYWNYSKNAGDDFENVYTSLGVMFDDIEKEHAVYWQHWAAI